MKFTKQVDKLQTPGRGNHAPRAADGKVGPIIQGGHNGFCLLNQTVSEPRDERFWTGEKLNRWVFRHPVLSQHRAFGSMHGRSLERRILAEFEGDIIEGNPWNTVIEKVRGNGN